MIALPSRAVLIDWAWCFLFTWPGLVVALAAASWAIYAVARRGRNSRTFKKALGAASTGLLIALGAAGWFVYYGKNANDSSHLSRIEILGAPEIVGAEDLAVIPAASPRLLIAALDRRKAGSEENGRLFLLDPARRHAPPEPLDFEGRDGCSFRPHGIDVVQEGRAIWIFVINHHLASDNDPERGCEPALHVPKKPMESIEVFYYQGPGRPLLFVERLKDPLLGHPNDLAAAGPRHLFVTVPNTGLLEIWNKFRGRCTGRVVEWNDGKWHDRATNLCFPNGIAVQKWADSPPASGAGGGPTLSLPPGADRIVWVATSLDGGLHRLSDETPYPKVFGSGAPDNLSWAGDDLLVAIHANGFQFAAAGLSAEIDGPPIASPGCVVRLRSPATRRPTDPPFACPQRKETSQIADVLFRGDGERMSAVSSAVCLGEDLYLGQVIERGIGRVEGACPSAPASATSP